MHCFAKSSALDCKSRELAATDELPKADRRAQGNDAGRSPRHGAGDRFDASGIGLPQKQFRFAVLATEFRCCIDGRRIQRVMACKIPRAFQAHAIRQCV